MEERYTYDHLVKILMERDGWLRVPLYIGVEANAERK